MKITFDVADEDVEALAHLLRIGRKPLIMTPREETRRRLLKALSKGFKIAVKKSGARVVMEDFTSNP